jgi:hypothetical protein
MYVATVSTMSSTNAYLDDTQEDGSGGAGCLRGVWQRLLWWQKHPRPILALPEAADGRNDAITSPADDEDMFDFYDARRCHEEDDYLLHNTSFPFDDENDGDHETILLPATPSWSPSSIMALTGTSSKYCLPSPTSSCSFPGVFLSSSCEASEANATVTSPSSTSTAVRPRLLTEDEAISTLNSLSSTISFTALENEQLVQSLMQEQKKSATPSLFHSSSWTDVLPMLPDVVKSSFLFASPSASTLQEDDSTPVCVPAGLGDKAVYAAQSSDPPRPHTRTWSDSSLASFLDYTPEEMALSDTEPTECSDLRSRPRPIFVVTTAALPWMTGTGKFTRCVSLLSLYATDPYLCILQRLFVQLSTLCFEVLICYGDIVFCTVEVSKLLWKTQMRWGIATVLNQAGIQTAQLPRPRRLRQTRVAHPPPIP